MQTLTSTARNLLEQDGGFSISLAGEFPHSGAMVSVYKDSETVIPFDSPLFDSEVEGFITRNLPYLRQQNHFFGGWVDDGKVYLDVSINAPLDEALELARRNDQLAVFDLATYQTVYVQ